MEETKATEEGSSRDRLEAARRSILHHARKHLLPIIERYGEYVQVIRIRRLLDCVSLARTIAVLDRIARELQWCLAEYTVWVGVVVHQRVFSSEDARSRVERQLETAILQPVRTFLKQLQRFARRFLGRPSGLPLVCPVTP